MAPDWPNAEFTELFEDLSNLQTALNAKKQRRTAKSKAQSKGQPNAQSKEKAMEEVDSSLEQLIEHPYNQPTLHCGFEIKREARGPGRRLHEALVRAEQLGEDDVAASEDEIEKLVLSFARRIHPSHPVLSTQPKVEESQENPPGRAINAGHARGKGIRANLNECLLLDEQYREEPEEEWEVRDGGK